MSSAPAIVSENLTALLIVSPDENLRNGLKSRLGTEHWRLLEAVSGAHALECLESLDGGIVLLDPNLPDLDATEFQSLIRSQPVHFEIMVLDPQAGIERMACTTANPNLRRLADMLGETAPQVARPLAPKPVLDKYRLPSHGLHGMIGESEAMQRVYYMTELVARRDTTVLISGASGTGKDLVAQAIHRLSLRHSHPFVVINCAAIPEPLLEAELFGYTKGAFTGAVQSRVGRIHSAQGGTLFLDEIAEMPLGLQSKLLRFLEQGEVQRLGSSDVFRVDVRVIAATNANLRKFVEEQKFREDLYYRLAVFPIGLPAMRDHLEDLPFLADHFLATFSSCRLSLSNEATSILLRHNWPGNVRELRNVIERATILAGNETQVLAKHILL